MTTALEPLGGSSAANSFAYWGARADWLVALSQHRDSDDVDRSNWETVTEHFSQMGFPENEDWAIERFSNWAAGWTEHLLVRPGTPAAAEAQLIRERLDNYPVFDDEHLSMLEWNEEWCTRCSRGTREQHYLGIVTRCKFRSESDRNEIIWKWRTRHDRG